MKNSIWHQLFVLLAALGLANTLSTYTFGQAQPPTEGGGSGVGLGACDNPPCAIVSCGVRPCNEDGRPNTISTGKTTAMPLPLTEEQQQARNEQFRYEDLFSTLAFYERYAHTEDAAGHANMAAGWRGYFAKKSGLNPDEAETVKKIAEEYLKEREITQKNYMDAMLTARSLPHTVRPSRLNTPAIAEAQDAMDSLFPSVKAKLVSALGSRSFSQLDGYTLHMHDNARSFTKPSEGVTPQ
jgi:hypothetical protein